MVQTLDDDYNDFNEKDYKIYIVIRKNQLKKELMTCLL